VSYSSPKRVNLATTDLTEFTSTIQLVPEVVSHPLQPPKPDSRPGVAVKVTVVPLTKDAEQLDPQSIPAGLDVTAPLPRPVTSTVRVKRWRLNRAVTDLAASMVT